MAHDLIGLGTAGVGTALLGAFKTLIAAALECKNDINVLPGMNP